jgi:hypothetical protein
MSNIVSIVFFFHFAASLAWFAVCGFGALKAVTQRVQQRLAGDAALSAAR